MTDVRVAVIGGAGFMGRAHSMALALAPLPIELGVTVRKQVLVEVDAGLAASTAAQLGWSESATDWEAVVARPDIDAIDICTPPDLHLPIALAALAAGKHVFCEKPLANRLEDAQAMAAAAGRSSLVTQVGFNYRHTPAVQLARRLMDEGRLGVPLQVRAAYLQETGFLADPEGRYTARGWRGRRDTGGSGMITDLGSHVVDMAEFLLGDIRRVAAIVRSKDGPSADTGWRGAGSPDAGWAVDDAGAWVAEFASGAIGTFAVNSFALGRKNRLELALDGSRAAIEFDWNHRDELRIARHDDPSAERGFRTIHTNTEHPNGWWRLAGLGTGYLSISAMQFQAFFRAIAEGRPSSPSFADGARVQQVLAAILEAATTGTWVDIAPRGAEVAA